MGFAGWLTSEATRDLWSNHLYLLRNVGAILLIRTGKIGFSGLRSLYRILVMVIIFMALWTIGLRGHGYLDLITSSFLSFLETLQNMIFYESS